jgi:hypothetical protein
MMMIIIISSTNPVWAVLSSFYKEPPVPSLFFRFLVMVPQKKKTSTISRGKNIIFKKSSTRNQNPSRYYNLYYN